LGRKVHAEPALIEKLSSALVGTKHPFLTFVGLRAPSVLHNLGAQPLNSHYAGLSLLWWCLLFSVCLPTIEPSLHPPSLEIFFDAAVVVGPTGGAFYNTIVCEPKNTIMIEFVPMMGVVSDLSYLALGLELVCSPVGIASLEPPFLSHHSMQKRRRASNS
jgi:hypothetical protein